jgi:hypothetical protein
MRTTAVYSAFKANHWRTRDVEELRFRTDTQSIREPRSALNQACHHRDITHQHAPGSCTRRHNAGRRLTDHDGVHG